MSKFPPVQKQTGSIGPQTSISYLHPTQTFFPIKSKNFHYITRSDGSYILATKTPSKQAVFSKPYQQGDPLKLIDWRAFARTDQLILREEHNESSAKIGIILEDSKSMYWPHQQLEGHLREATPRQKIEIGVRISLNLFLLHLQTGDRVSFFLYDGARRKDALRKVNLLNIRSDVMSFFMRCRDDGFSKQSLQGINSKPIDRQPKQDRLYWVGDTLESNNFSSIIKENRGLSLIHTLSSLELDPSWLAPDLCYFSDSEDTKEYLGRTLKVEDNYLNRIKAWITESRTRVCKNQGKYILTSENTSIAEYSRFIHSVIKE